MRLEHGGWGALASGARRLAHDDVAGSIDLGWRVNGAGDLEHVLANALLVLRGTRNGQHAVEVPPERWGIECLDEGHDVSSAAKSTPGDPVAREV
jgi:hypothetical protein